MMKTNVKGIEMDTLFNSKHDELFNAKEILKETGYEYSFSELGKLTIEKQKGIVHSIGEISNWVYKWVMMLNDLNGAREALKRDGFKTGDNERYIGLTAKDSEALEEFKNELTKSKVVEISYELDRATDEEINNCIWSDENITKYILDKIIVGRLYQEKTIDYAKKMSKLEIQKSPMRFVKPLSLQPLTLSLMNGRIEADLVEPSDYFIVSNDLIHQTRMNFSKSYKKYMEERILPLINKSELPKEITEELSMLRNSKNLEPFKDMKQYYGDIVGGFISARDAAIENDEEELISIASENFKEDKKRITNMLRIGTAYMTPEERGSHMKFVSGRTKNNEVAEKENKFSSAICREEYIHWLNSMDLAEAPFAGHKLISNKGYEEGNIVHFENGMSAKAILNNDFTGWAEIREFNGSLYAAIDLENTLPQITIDNKIIIKVQQGFINKKLENGKVMTTEEIIKELMSAEKVEFRAQARQYDMKLTKSNGEEFAIPYDLNKWFFNILRGMTGKVVKTTINTGTSYKTNTKYDSIYVSIDLDDVPEVTGIPVFKEDKEEDVFMMNVIDTDEI